eukprot:CAMPEP_0184007452 /NCGR_PEP_ID=MMETSP0954-20121128/1338_1 /TAXON_ID=627963 /ORGANISM="Aplanochytrium sp, Strain PBS07" /LENGTH=565 /DNA_ID=CAMNT_0026286277 /DNA_START=140 /DNA_END=1834 /DNA_ORIENTATION=-
MNTLEKEKAPGCCSTLTEWGLKGYGSIKKKYEEETGQPIENALFVGALFYIFVETGIDLSIVYSDYGAVAEGSFILVNGTKYTTFVLELSGSVWTLFDLNGTVLEQGIDYENEVIEVDSVSGIEAYFPSFATVFAFFGIGVALFLHQEIFVVFNYLSHQFMNCFRTKLFCREPLQYKIWSKYEKVDVQDNLKAGLVCAKLPSLLADVLILGLLMAPPCRDLSEMRLVYEGVCFLLEKERARYLVGILFLYVYPLMLLPLTLEMTNLGAEFSPRRLFFGFSLFLWLVPFGMIANKFNRRSDDEGDNMFSVIIQFSAILGSFLNGFGFCSYYSINDYPDYLCNFGYFVVVVGICFCFIPSCLLVKIMTYDKCKYPNETFLERFGRYFSDNASPLHQQLKFHSIAKAKTLIHSGANVNGTDNYGTSCLMSACSTGNLDLVKLLVKNGADIHVKTKKGKVALMFVASKTQVPNEDHQIVSYLVNHGADVNAQEDWGKSALFIVETSEMAQTFIDNGADVNLKDNKGNTALHSAVVRGRKVVVEVLLENGADPYIKNHKGNRPIDFTNQW